VQYPLPEFRPNMSAPSLASLGPLFHQTNPAVLAVWQGHQTAAAMTLMRDNPGQYLAEPLPIFIRDLNHKMDSVDVICLQAKGAFRIPGEKLRVALLSAYADYVHPTMPVVDLHSFLNAIDKPGPGEAKVSLLLFQSMMFAASAFVDEEALVEAGFTNRLDARRTLYERCKVCVIWGLIV
jgi:hypothetical protein